MKKVIVTGGAGFIGSHLVDSLLDRGIEVIVLDSWTYAAHSVDSRAKSVIFDIRHDDFTTYMRDVDTVFHLAAETHVDNSIKNSRLFIDTNVIGTYNLLEACRGQGVRLISVSTDEVFGDLSLKDAPFTESHPFRPSSPYSASKAAGDHLVHAWGRTYGLDVIVTHCSNNFGPRQNAEKLIPKVIDSIKKAKPIPVYGTGKNVRDWIFVKDHCEALMFVAENGVSGESYNVGGENELTNLEIIEKVADVMGKYAYIKTVEDRKGHDFRYAIDNTKIRSLGWNPRFNFEKALKITINEGDNFSRRERIET